LGRPYEAGAKKPLVNRRYRLLSNAYKTAIWFLKACSYPVRSIDGQRDDHGSASQDQERASGETAWTVLDAANDLGDTITVDACRRVIDADLRGEAPARSDMAVLTAFFG
jgi:hypothetical protein